MIYLRRFSSQRQLHCFALSTRFGTLIEAAGEATPALLRASHKAAHFSRALKALSLGQSEPSPSSMVWMSDVMVGVGVSLGTNAHARHREKG